MSQQQVTPPMPSSVNGFDQSRTDRDLGSHYNNQLMQSPKSRLGNSSNTSMGHNLYRYTKNEHVGHTNHNRVQGGNSNISRRGGFGRALHDRLLFMTACLIGQPVEVQVKNGSIFSGIFHTTNAEKDYGVVLRMARLIKDGSIKGGKCDDVKDAANKGPIKTLIILANDLVQVIAKDVPITTGDALANGHAYQNRHDIAIDSLLSQAHHVELERELEPWTPDKDAPENLGLEDTFQNTWNRNWDQFETNKTLFGVKSTYDEELYTTKLERGPQTKDLEKEAYRIAREIEGQVSRNFHLAEERGIHVSNELDSLDEESRFSSVLRELGDDVGEDDEDTCIDNHNDETFSSNFSYNGVAPIVCKDNNGCIPDITRSEKNSNHAYISSADSAKISSSACEQLELEVQATSLDTKISSVSVNNCRKISDSNLEDNAKKCKKQLNDKVNASAEVLQNKSKVFESYSKKLPGGEKLSSVDKEPELVPKEDTPVPTTKVPASVLGTDVAYAPPASALPMPTGLGGLSTSGNYPHLEGTKCIAEPSPSATSKGSLIRTGSSSSMGTELTATTIISTFSVSSPGSSVGSASSEKSTLNPFAKEFKLNPNAKSFTPGQSGLRKPSPGGQGPFHMPSNIPPIPHMHGLSLGLGSSSLVQQPAQPLKFGPQSNSLTASGVTSATYYQPAASFSPTASGSSILTSFPAVSTGRIPAGQQIGHPFSGHHPIIYNSQAPSVQSASTYIHQNGHLYPQHMMLGQPGQVVYIPPFPQEMMQGPPPPHGLIPSFATPQQGQQPKHRGGS